MGPRGVRAGPRVGPLCGVGGRLLGGLPLLSANNHFTLVACVGPGRQDADRTYCDKTVAVTTASQSREWGEPANSGQEPPLLKICHGSPLPPQPRCPPGPHPLPGELSTRHVLSVPPRVQPQACLRAFALAVLSADALRVTWLVHCPPSYLRVSSSGASSLQPYLTPNLPQPSLLPDTTSTPRRAAVMPTAPWEIQPVC